MGTGPFFQHAPAQALVKSSLTPYLLGHLLTPADFQGSPSELWIQPLWSQSLSRRLGTGRAGGWDC